jgi:hypothetical protein
MNTLTKSHWVSDGNRLSLSMPIAKVDQENRLVSGFATLDNVDSQGDVVLAEASKEAFARARGNIREMHQPIAVGKMVDFREEEFYHDGEFYRGIFVTAYVSKGAEATWEKVLDGTLTGFSIGGNIIEASNEFVKEQGKSVRFIKSYDLVELSLVDNPANQLANVFSITKSSDGHTMVKGMVAELHVENIFYCTEDEITKAVSAESADCSICGKPMQNIGWVEADQDDRAEKVRDVVTKFLGSNAANNEGEGGVKNMGIRKAADNEGEGVVTSADVNAEEETKTPLEELKEEAQNDNVENPVDEEKDKAEALEEVDHSDETTEPDEHDLGKEAEEGAQGIDETPDADEEISKKIDSLKDAVQTSLEKTRKETAEQVAALEKKIAENNEAFLSKVSDLENKFSEFGEELKTAKAKTAELEKSLDALNNEGSFKKSGDVETTSEGTVQKANTWNGAFSIDNLLK